MKSGNEEDARLIPHHELCVAHRDKMRNLFNDTPYGRIIIESLLAIKFPQTKGIKQFALVRGCANTGADKFNLNLFHDSLPDCFELFVTQIGNFRSAAQRL